MKRFMKSLMTSLFAVLLIALSAVTVLADSTVTYDGTAQKFVFGAGSKYSPTDLFDGFKSVMPGDTLTQKITVDNKASEKVKIKLYLRSTGAEEGSEAFLSQLNLTVAQDGDSVMFKAPADQTAGLTDWVYLGTVYSGGKVDLDLKLEVPATLGNEFQNAVGTLDWQFKVEELPIEKDDPAPVTGENSHVLLWVIIAVIMVAILAVCVLLGKKKKD